MCSITEPWVNAGMPSARTPSIDRCLRRPCDVHAPCDDALCWPRVCLTATIPAWGPSLAHIECCLRCCLRHWTRRLGLDVNVRHWKEQGTNFWVSSGAGHAVSRGDDAVSPFAPSTDSMLYARFSLARFAHVQAVELRDWTELVALPPQSWPLPARIASPSALAANGTLIVLNGWGFGENVSSDGSCLTHRLGHAGKRYMFEDPLPRLFGVLRGRHVVNYGNDHAISSHLLERYYHRKLGEALFRYLAPNLDDEASRLAYGVTVPLGLNSNGVGLDALLKGPRGRKHTAHAHRRRELLCCCMEPRRHRLRVLHTLQQNGFACSNATLPWQQTMELYLEHRFVLAIFGNGRNDFRYWEALSTGAVPVVQYFASQDALFEGLPVVRVRSWAALTPAALDDEWYRIQEGVSNGSISWTKVFLPYWFHRHTEHIQPQTKA
jgi:hypothetical protein